MKKTLLSFITISGLCTASSAQIELKAEAGANFSNLAHSLNAIGTQKLDSDFKTGPRAALLIASPIGKRWFGETGLVYVQNGYKRTLTTGDHFTNPQLAPLLMTSNINYVQIPVNVGHKIVNSDKFGSLMLSAGPYIGYALSGKLISKAEKTTTKNDLPLGNDSFDFAKRLDFGVNAALSYQLPIGLYLKAQYQQGILNLSPANRLETIRNYGISVSVGYALKLTSGKQSAM